MMNFNIILKSIMSDEVLWLTFKVYFVELNCPEANELPDFTYITAKEVEASLDVHKKLRAQRNILFLILVW